MRGLVLEGGGLKGSYQIGAFYALMKCGIKFDGFVGTSIGSFNAAMLASNKYRELLDFWYNLDISKVLSLDEKFIEEYNKNKKSFSTLKEAFAEFGDFIRNHGIKYEGMMDAIDDLLNYNDLKKSNKDFGLVTVQVSGGRFKHKYVYKNQIMNKRELAEYIMASCYFPGIKQRKIIDNHYYLDGGFYDNSPVEMLLDKKYDEIYVINVKGIGFYRKNKNVVSKIVNLKPSRGTGLIFELDKNVIRDNIMMGYYDTLRTIKKLDGFKFCFKARSKQYYSFITRKVSKRLLTRVMNFFNTKSVKKACIRALEYVMEHDGISYYDVYDVIKVSKNFRDKEYNHFVYRFVQKLKFFF